MVSTHLKNISQIGSSNWIISPNRGENKKYLKPPSSLDLGPLGPLGKTSGAGGGGVVTLGIESHDDLLPDFCGDFQTYVVQRFF